MQEIKNFNQLKIDESYLIFLGYDYSSSGFDIGTLNLSGRFEMQGSGSEIPFTPRLQVFTLPETN